MNATQREIRALSLLHAMTTAGDRINGFYRALLEAYDNEGAWWVIDRQLDGADDDWRAARRAYRDHLDTF